MKSGGADPETGYALDNAWQQAERRLSLLESCLDPPTQRRISQLGVGAGWCCLEAGAGGGSITRWLCSQVGDGGRVMAVDLDTRFVERVDATNLEIRRLDLVGDPLPQEAFDFVHTRLVLMHIPQREQVLARLITALRPGGVLLVEEHDIFPLEPLAGGAYAEAWQIFVDRMRSAGLAPDWARDLPALADSLGLDDVVAEVDVQLFRGGSDHAGFWGLTWLQASEHAIKNNPDVAKIIEEGRAALGDNSAWFWGPAMVSVSGRKP
jgi:SAM-dependent methyltransferase